MPFKAGQVPPPGAGRPKGSINKDRQSVLDKATALGVDPLQVLLLFAKGDAEGLKLKPGEEVTADQRLKAATEASQYLYAKRRAQEISGPNGEPVEEFVRQAKEFESMSKEQLIHIVEEELSKIKGE
jgi:hypothetical protein